MKWYTNGPDPRGHEKNLIGYGRFEMTWEQYVKWASQFVIGPPKPTNRVSLEYLQSHGYVGFYAKENKG